MIGLENEMPTVVSGGQEGDLAGGEPAMRLVYTIMRLVSSGE